MTETELLKIEVCKGIGLYIVGAAKSLFEVAREFSLPLKNTKSKIQTLKSVCR